MYNFVLDTRIFLMITPLSRRVRSPGSIFNEIFFSLVKIVVQELKKLFRVSKDSHILSGCGTIKESKEFISFKVR